MTWRRHESLGLWVALACLPLMPGPAAAHEGMVSGPWPQSAPSNLEHCLETGEAARGVMPAIMECQRDEFRRVDGELNRLYNRIRARLSVSEKRRLLISERQWINRRRTRCTPEADPAQDQVVDALFCDINETNGRIQWLRRHYPDRADPKQ